MKLEEGRQLIRLARAAIKNKELEIKGFCEKQGVFVTLNSYPSGGLRGCIGFPQPVMALKDAVIQAAKSAAFSDPRFEPLGRDEQYTVEISVLTVPERISGNPLKSFTIGKHGLIIDCNGRYGLLLPQVFTEWKATTTRALQMTCEKAGLSVDAWKDKSCKIYKFEAQIFIEETPAGKVVERQ